MKRKVFALLAVIFMSFSVISNQVFAIEYGGIGGRPANPREDNPRTQDIFVYTLEPGSTKDDGVIVINNKAEDKTIFVYSADSTPSSDGGFACKQLLESTRKVSDDKKGVGSWITFSITPKENLALPPNTPAEQDSDGDGLTDVKEVELQTDPKDKDTDGDSYEDALEVAEGHDPLQPLVLSLKAGTNVIVPFVVSVPETASVGEQNGCILIQEKPRASNENAEGISISTRTGLRVSITVPGAINRKLEVAGLTVTPQQNGSATIHPAVRNVGNVSVDADLSVVTKNMFGKNVAEHGGQYPILRETTSEWNFDLPAQFWGGWFRTLMSVAYDRDATLVPGEEGKDRETLVGPTVTFFLMPSLYAILVYAGGVLSVAALAVVWRLSVRRKRWIRNTWVEYAVQPRDDIRALSHTHNVSWKLLVRVNKLKAPFTLNPGSSIKVPPKP